MAVQLELPQRQCSGLGVEGPEDRDRRVEAQLVRHQRQQAQSEQA